MIIEVLKNNTFEEIGDLPAAATEKSSGFDIFASQEPQIVGDYDSENEVYLNVSYIQYKTNLKMSIQSEKIVTGVNKTQFVDYDVLIFPRSSVSKYNLTLANSIGLVDQDYQGEVLLRFKYVWQPEDYRIIDGKICGKINFDKIYKKGEKIGQLKISQRETTKFVLVNNFNEVTERGSGGFGHTDNKVLQANENMSTIKALYDSYGMPGIKPKTYIEKIKERDTE